MGVAVRGSTPSSLGRESKATGRVPPLDRALERPDAPSPRRRGPRRSHERALQLLAEDPGLLDGMAAAFCEAGPAFS